MHTLLLLFLCGLIGAQGAKPQAAVAQRDPHCGQPLTPLILVADGSSNWAGEAANRVVGEFKALLGSCHPLQVARFDAEPVLQHGFSVTGANRDLVVVRPRTPMREAMEASLARLIDAPRPHTMVVLAHEQFYPTTVSTGRLLELARRSETQVHTIHLLSSRERVGVFRRLGRSLRNGIIWLVEALGLEERGYSARDTARLLQVMVDATGGQACVTGDERTGIDCARLIAAEIVSRPTRTVGQPVPNSR